jgi:glycosyltransferase involved in cell wall biosynthesis
VIFSGFRSDTPDVLAAMDIFVFPSHAEAFGIALAEAMAVGKPCIASNSDGILDLIDDRKNGYLFENKSAEDLEKKMEEMILSAGQRDAMGKAARISAVKKFDISVLTEKTIDYYKKYLVK